MRDVINKISAYAVIEFCSTIQCRVECGVDCTRETSDWRVIKEKRHKFPSLPVVLMNAGSADC